MMQGPITIQNTLGLHARPSAKFVACASQFPCRVSLQHNGVTVNGKSLMAILTLAASQGAQLTMITQGEQEQEAFSALLALVNHDFGETL